MTVGWFESNVSLKDRRSIATSVILISVMVGVTGWTKTHSISLLVIVAFFVLFDVVRWLRRRFTSAESGTDDLRDAPTDPDGRPRHLRRSDDF